MWMVCKVSDANRQLAAAANASATATAAPEPRGAREGNKVTAAAMARDARTAGY